MATSFRHVEGAPSSTAAALRLTRTGFSSAAVGLGLCLAPMLVVFRLQLHAARGLRHGLRHGERLLRIAFESLFGHLHEGFLDGDSFDRARLVEEHVVVVAGPRLSLGRGHLTFLLLV